MNCLEDNNLLSRYEYGYGRVRSTDLAATFEEPLKGSAEIGLKEWGKNVKILNICIT